MRKVFISISAAPGNIGDIYIRREVINILSVGIPDVCGVVYVGRMPDSYVDAFDLRHNWKTTTSYVNFLLQFAIACLSNRAVMVMAPGPAHLGGGVKSLVKHGCVAALMAITRLSGNAVLTVGRAVRGANLLGRSVEKLIIQFSNVYIVRDTLSAQIMKSSKVQVLPDIAFASARRGLGDQSNRKYGVISLRYDRLVEDKALDDLVAKIRDAGRTPIFVVQVQEDGLSCKQHAKRLGVEILDWPEGRSHARQEEAVFSIYEKSAVVVSDRLHALIFGALSGAVPIMVARVGDDKLHTTLDTFLGCQSIRLDGLKKLDGLNLDTSEIDRIASGVRECRELWVQQTEGLISSALGVPHRSPCHMYSTYTSASRKKGSMLITASLANYRLPTMNGLKGSLGDELTIVGGDAAPDGDIRLIDPAFLDYQVVRNRFFGNGFLYQDIPWLQAINSQCLVLDLNPRVIHVWILLILRRVLRRRTLVWGHAWPRAGRGSKTDAVRGLIRLLAGGLITYTHEQARELRAVYPSKQIVAAPNSLYKRSDILALDTDRARDTFIYVGRLIPEKKPLLLVESFIEVLSKGPDLRLCLVGDGPEMAQVVKLAAESPYSDRISILGHVDNYAILREHYRRAIASVSPGYVGLSITQSLSFGVPMIVSRNEPHAPEIESAVEGFNCIFFESDDTQSLARSLEIAADGTSKYFASRSAIAAHCRDNYSVEKMVDGLKLAFEAGGS
ncbi:glycosyltransferase [Rhodococcus fascians]|nr:glycosyltransferase [Rhodococcus fascians]